MIKLSGQKGKKSPSHKVTHGILCFCTNHQEKQRRRKGRCKNRERRAVRLQKQTRTLSENVPASAWVGAGKKGKGKKIEKIVKKRKRGGRFS